MHHDYVYASCLILSISLKASYISFDERIKSAFGLAILKIKKLKNQHICGCFRIQSIPKIFKSARNICVDLEIF